MLVFPLMAAWLVVPPALGYLIGRWWALALSLPFFPAFLVWNEVKPASSIPGEQVIVMWFIYLMAFLFLTLPPLGLTAVAIAWRRWA